MTATPTASTPVPPAAQPVASPLHLVSRLKSPEDSQQLQAAMAANFQVMNDNLNAIGTVHFAHWFFLDNGLTIILVTEFDGAFDAYVKDFVQHIGDLFNVLLSHVVDPPQLPVQQYPDAFVQWVNAHNVPVFGALYSAYPTLTVLDIRAAANSNS